MNETLNEESDNQFLSSLNSPPKSRSYVWSSTEHKQLSASPVVNKNLELDEKRKRVRKYNNATNMKSEYYAEARVNFRKRTFKKIKDMGKFL